MLSMRAAVPLLVAPLLLWSSSAYAQRTLPRTFAGLSLGMRVSAFQRLLPGITCLTACDAEPVAYNFSPSALPGLRTAIRTLGVDSAALDSERPASATFYRGKLMSIAFSVHIRDGQVAVSSVSGELGQWEEFVLSPYTFAFGYWRDGKTEVALSFEMGGSTLQSAIADATPRLLLVTDRQAKALVEATAAKR